MKQLLGLVLLAGCPASYGLNGHLVTTSEPVSAIAIDAAGKLVSPQLAPIANARVECTGCSQPITVDAQGRFHVAPAGSGPLTLRIAAEGYEPVELALARSPIVSQAGLAELVIMLRPQ